MFTNMKQTRKLGMWMVLIVITLLVSMVVSAEVTFQRFPNSVQGHITDVDTGEGIYGAIVVIGDSEANYMTTVSGENGFYEFLQVASHCNDVFPYHVPVKVLKSSYDNAISSYTMPCSWTTSYRVYLDISMQAKPGTGVIIATVVDECNNPMPSVRVQTGTAVSKSGEDGVAQLRVSPNTYTVIGRLSNYVNYVQPDIVVASDAVVDVPITMVRADGIQLNVAEVCDDLVDNDCDGDVDCADSDCAATCGVCECSDIECREPLDGFRCDTCNYNDVSLIMESGAECDDGEDDDCDGLVDCADSQCAGSTYCEDCTNSMDDDDDTLIDCEDPDCSEYPACFEDCTNNIDDDGDGLDDMNDPDCFAIPYDCDDDDSAVNPGAVEICDNFIDDDCDTLIDDLDPDCAAPCAFTDAYWSEEEVSDGTEVTLTVEATDCDDQEVYFNIFEDDVPFDILDDYTNDEFVVNPRAFFVAGKAEVTWNAIYLNDWPVNPPEYYFDAELVLDSDVDMRSQGPSADGLLIVTGNEPPIPVDPFLIEPDGGELYDESAIVRWNPGLDPEEDPILYTLYYSADSGINWNLMKDDYGLILDIGAKRTISLNFDAVCDDGCFPHTPSDSIIT